MLYANSLDSLLEPKQHIAIPTLARCRPISRMTMSNVLEVKQLWRHAGTSMFMIAG